VCEVGEDIGQRLCIDKAVEPFVKLSTVRVSNASLEFVGKRLEAAAKLPEKCLCPTPGLALGQTQIEPLSFQLFTRNRHDPLLLPRHDLFENLAENAGFNLVRLEQNIPHRRYQVIETERQRRQPQSKQCLTQVGVAGTVFENQEANPQPLILR